MNTLEKVIGIIHKNMSSEAEIGEDADLRKDLGIDSFDALMIMNAVDEEFAISVDEDEFKNVKTPRDIVLLLQEKYGIHEV